MDSGAGCCGMKNQAGGGERVVRDAGALAGRQVGVGFASHHHGDASGGERGAKADGERESDVLLDARLAGDARAGVGASVSGVDHD